jgi:hypothetical protein
MFVVMYVFYGVESNEKADNLANFRNIYFDPKLGKEIKSKENCARAKVLMNRNLTPEFTTQLTAGVMVLNHSRGLNLNVGTDLKTTILNNITRNLTNYIVYLIEDKLTAISQKEQGKFKYQVDRSKTPIQFIITDADAGQESKLKLARDAAKAVGSKLTQFDQFLHSQYNLEEDFYEEDEFEIRRYDRSKAYARRAAPSVKVK